MTLMGTFWLLEVIVQLSMRVCRAWQSSPSNIIHSCLLPLFSFIFTFCVYIHGFKEVNYISVEGFLFICLFGGTDGKLGLSSGGVTS